MKARANIVLDTSDLKPKELREKIVHLFSTETEQAFRVNVMSFDLSTVFQLMQI